jgi:glycosyltransferase involved in cell wall biosynthesis
MLAVPTIATTVGGFPDLVRPGETGWLVPPRDPPALAGAIREALADRAAAKRMALAGQALARHLFDDRRTAAEVHDAYRRILARESAAAPAGTPEHPATTSA